ILRARLYDLEMKRRQEAKDAAESQKMDISFGSQIRSYVLAPYQMVKDHRTEFEMGDPQRVLDGDLDRFIEAELRRRASA
ncbi:MAG TPA: peptide chain release factor 2, partial [Actinomycetota bacterium]